MSTKAPGSDNDEGRQRLLGLLSESFDEDLEDERVEELAALTAQHGAQESSSMLRLEIALRATGKAPASVADAVVRTLAARQAGPAPVAAAAAVAGKHGGRAARIRRLRWSAGLALAIAGLAAAAPALWQRLTTAARAPGAADPGTLAQPVGGAAANPATPPVNTAPEGPGDPPPQAGLPQERSDITADPAAVDPAPDPRVPVVVRRFDFEDGRLPPEFTSGEVVSPEIPRENSRHAVLGTQGEFTAVPRSIVFHPEGWLVAYDDELVLRFQYFLEPGSKGIRLQIYNRDQRQNYQFNYADAVVNQWAEAEVRLRDFYPVKDKSKRFEPGSQLTTLYLMGGRLGGARFFADDIEILRAPAPE